MSDANALNNDFRRLETPRAGSRACQLFRASSSAFASLSRPTKTEVQQFQDLSLALYDRVPESAKRHAAVMIAGNAFAPRELVWKLANEPAGVAAPLLARSPVLQARDIPPLIARHGIAHARLLAQRTDLEPPLRALLSVYIQQAENEGGAAKIDEPAMQAAASPAGRDTAVAARPARAVHNGSLEDVRAALRGAMAANSGRPMLPETVTPAQKSPQSRLQPTALMENPAFFTTALADALELPYPKAAAIVEEEGQAGLIMALRSIPLLAEEAFVIAAALWPGAFARRSSVARFLERYRNTAIDAARDRVAAWRDESDEAARRERFTGHEREAARNDDKRAPSLRAS